MLEFGRFHKRKIKAKSPTAVLIHTLNINPLLKACKLYNSLWIVHRLSKLSTEPCLPARAGSRWDAPLRWFESAGQVVASRCYRNSSPARARWYRYGNHTYTLAIHWQMLLWLLFYWHKPKNFCFYNIYYKRVSFNILN